MNYIDNDKLDKFYKNYLNDNLQEYSSNGKKELAFIGKLILSDGSSTEDIPESNIIEDKTIDIIWHDQNYSNKNYSFIKIMDREDILKNHDNFDWIKNTKNKYIDSEFTKIIDEYFDDNEKTYLNYIIVNKSKNKISNKKTIEKNFNNWIEKKENENFKILEIEDLINNYSNIYESKLYIEKGELEIFNDNKNNYLKFETNYKDSLIDESYIFSISANSLKELYKSNGNSILNLNLRFFKKNKKVDEDITYSINNPKYFWQFNNGLVIMCDSLDVKRNKIKLKNFSIINGGQTTYNISHTNFKDDFFLIAKIICIKNWINDDKNAKAFNLANDIAIASNKQKPINNKDLIANLGIANELKELYLKNRNNIEFPIYLETKSGSFNNDSNNSIFYKKDNVFSVEQLLQLYWAFHELKPGTARNQKGKIYEKRNLIETSLKDIKNDYIFYSELIYLFKIFNKLKTKKYIDEIKVSKIKVQIIKNFIYYNLILIKFMFGFESFSLKGERSIFTENISQCKNEEELKDFIQKYDNEFTMPKHLFTESFWKQKDHIELVFKLILEYDCFMDALKDTLDALNQDESYIHNMTKNNYTIAKYLDKFFKYYKLDDNFKNLVKQIFNVSKEEY